MVSVLMRTDISERLLKLPMMTQAVFLHLSLYAGHAGVVSGRTLNSAKRFGCDTRRQLLRCITELADARLLDFEDRSEAPRCSRMVRIVKAVH